MEELRQPRSDMAEFPKIVCGKKITKDGKTMRGNGSFASRDEEKVPDGFVLPRCNLTSGS